ncbi:hypothetical protein ACFOTA_02960 [Chitinophaga sp. GCM10012297]|uniref:Lipocalin-like domain-containing protein n=1 Tax=Chitinophaga chungangae TaxID=2821488 RepID=A0ABS3Y939_9BACT|nr:hypothetical protein [Chitinophaga chungangae]MBO9151151.1 hypothetical protein [Chitinophaga chungangae]
MKKYLLLTCVLMAVSFSNTAAQYTDTSALRLTGKWELEKVTVKETAYGTGALVKEYTLTDKTRIGTVRAELLTEMEFRGNSYRSTRQGRTEGGVFIPAGNGLVRLTRQQPDDQWHFTYSWARPSEDILILARPYTVTEDTSGQLIKADYTCQYRRIPQKQ